MDEVVLRGFDLGVRAGRDAWPLRGATLELRAGEVLGVVGPNGAGKSTLLRLLAGLLRPSEGGVALLGRPLAEWGAGERARRLGYLPQHFAPHWDYTVRELLRLGLERGGGGAARDLAAAAGEHGVAALLPRRWSTLSGGERGRALAAAVLAPRPRAVLADEAAAALDVAQAAALMGRLRGAARGGAAVALVAHDLNLALRGCDRVLVLAGGRVSALGTPASLAAGRALDEAFGLRFRRVVVAEDGPVPALLAPHRA